jgi:phosphatidylethanolamine-binding protein (PEBP) family uncharacterized protein
MKKIIFLLVIIVFASSSNSFSNEKFTIEFEWGNIPRCNSGSPNTVSNPIFKLKNVPEGTTTIDFLMRDRNVPSFYHGGGTVTYTKQTRIEPGAFQYKSPCPPSGAHTYEWTAIARNDQNKKIAEAEAIRKYPE